VRAGHHSSGSSIHKQQMQAGQQAVAASVIVAPEVKVPFSLAQVAVFLAVARTGSPTSASLACSISQPAVSKSLSGLEQVITLSSFLTADSHDDQVLEPVRLCMYSPDEFGQTAHPIKGHQPEALILAGFRRAAGLQDAAVRASPADRGRAGSTALLPAAGGGGRGGLQGHAGLQAG